VLVTNLAYVALISLFPLLPVLVTILGLAASIEGAFRQAPVNAVASQVSPIGHVLTANVQQSCGSPA
jgi:uncharacterized BrkB/YihY/UPF0761 family membrane protein